MARDWRFHVGRAKAAARIGFDYLHSLALPPAAAPARGPALLPEAGLTTRPGSRHGPLPPRLRLLSWNIHRGYDAAGVASGLRALMGDLEPHAVLLQEVPFWPTGPWWNEPGIRGLLAAHHLVFAPMHQVRRPTSYYPFRETGLLVAVRGEVEAARGARMPIVSRPKLGPGHVVERVAVGVRCRAGGRGLSLWNVHLENTTRPRGRELQARAAAAAVEAGPAVVVGDFNTMLWPLERVERTLAEEGFARACLSGHWRPGPQLDHFFLRGVRALRAERLDVRGSDHLPIFAEIDVERCTSGSSGVL